MKTVHSLLFTFVVLFMIGSCSESDDSGVVSENEEGNQDSDVESISIFPSSHPLNMDITALPVSVDSQSILENIGLNTGLFSDFASGTWNGAPIGIPYVVVNDSQPLVSITYTDYGDESDPGPFPIPLDAPIEGNGTGDSHVIAVDTENGVLYELFNASRADNGWNASSGAVFNLNVEEYRPLNWTSADAAGLPIFPLLIRYSEIEKGEIDHAMRFTLTSDNLFNGFVHPARHKAAGGTNSNQLPMGGRLRLKADVDISSFSETNQIILKAMKKYGLILADGGSNMFISGAPSDKWDDDDLKNLGDIKVSDFEVIELGDIIE